MANVPSLDNNLPIRQASTDSTATTDNSNVAPFGQWLAQESEPRPAPKPIQFRAQEGQQTKEEQPAQAQKTKKLFSETLAKPAKKLRSLFKSKASQANQQTADTKPVVPNARTTARSIAFKATNTSAETVQKLKPGKTATAANLVKNATANAGQVKQAKGKPAQAVPATPVANQKAARTRSAVPAAPTKPATPNVTTKPDALTQLKTDVKAIFNSLSPLKTSSPSQTTNLRAFQQPKEPGITLSTDRVKPIRLTTTPVIKETTGKDGKTTLEHLKARKATRLDVKVTDQQAETRVVIRDTAGKGENAAQQASAGTKKAGNLAAQVSAANENLEKPVQNRKKARLRSKKKAQQAAQAKQARQQQAPVAGQESPGMFKDADAIRDTLQTQQAALQTQSADSSQADTASSDSNANNLMGRSEAAAQLASSKSTAKAAPTYASRSVAWLKALADRTGQMNRQDPNWKVLEMKLDRGDGQMTIKVSREDDQVSIAVQFSDEAVRAQAESQSTQILESLKEQYGEDVAFSFTNEQKSNSSSSMDERASRRRRLRADVIAQEKAAQTQPYARSNPDQHIWIG